MLKLALFFFIISIIAGVFGFTGISAATAGIAKVLFFIFIIVFMVLLVYHCLYGPACRRGSWWARQSFREVESGIMVRRREAGKARKDRIRAQMGPDYF